MDILALSLTITKKLQNQLLNVVLQMMGQYSSVISRNMLAPHIFAISDAAFSSLCADNCSQCCVVSGESGAGMYFSICW